MKGARNWAWQQLRNNNCKKKKQQQQQNEIGQINK